MPLDRRLVVINGLPATGKTAIGRAMSSYLQIPLFSKDDYKEAMFDRLYCKDREWSKQVGAAAIKIHFLVVESCLRAGQSCIMENFMRPVTVDNFSERISDLCQRYGFAITQVLVKAEGATLYRRFAERAMSGNRHRGHCDLQCLAEHKPTLMQGRLEPLDLSGPLV